VWDTLKVFEQHVRLPAVDMPHSPLGESATRIDIEMSSAECEVCLGILPDRSQRRAAARTAWRRRDAPHVRFASS